MSKLDTLVLSIPFGTFESMSHNNMSHLHPNSLNLTNQIQVQIFEGAKNKY